MSTTEESPLLRNSSLPSSSSNHRNTSLSVATEESSRHPSTPAASLRTSEDGDFFWFARGSTSLRHMLSNLGRSERDKALLKEGVGQAAFLLRDAVLGDDVENPAEGAYDPYLTMNDQDYRVRNSISTVCRRLCAYRPLVRLFHAACWCLVFLTFVEPPAWCRDYGESDEGTLKGCPAYLSAKGKPAVSSEESSDKVDEVQLYPNSHSNLISKEQSLQLEAFFLLIILLFIMLRLGRDGMSLSRYFRRGFSQTNRVVQAICLVAMSAGVAMGNNDHHAYGRLALLLSLNPFNCQRDMKVLVNMIPSTMNILILLGLLILFYGWFGCVMFVGTSEGSEFFPNLLEACWTLWICVTTANYPDVMMPAYNLNRWVSIYFVSFMIISFFFLMNLILAAVVNEYDTSVSERREASRKASDECLKKAFKLLDPHQTGRIDRETVMALFCILNEDFPEFRELSKEETALLFAFLDKDGSSTITEDEFMDFGSVMLLEFDRESDYTTWVQRYCPKVFLSPRYQNCCRVIKSEVFEYAVDLILMLNAVVIGIQTYPELSGQTVVIDQKYFDGSIDTPWEIAETGFTFIYCLEIFLKVTVYGWKAYAENQRNMFDFTITMLALISSGIVYYPNDFSDSRLIRMIVMLRVIRLVRLLAAIRPFQMLFRVSAVIFPEAASVIFLLFSLLYGFAALGLQLYGGMITRNPDDELSYLLLDTDFSENEYWANNFNDMVSGMNVLFNLLVVNNWTECEVGFEAVTASTTVRFFFLSFHILGVIFVNNLVIAFIISSFFDQLEIARERPADELVGDGEAILRGRRAMFDAAEVTGTKTSLTGGYIARFRHKTSDRDTGEEKAILRKLFTQTSSLGEVS